jgi:hypothetical protein
MAHLELEHDLASHLHVSNACCLMRLLVRPSSYHFGTILELLQHLSLVSDALVQLP